MPLKLKTVLRFFFIALTAFSLHFGLAWLADSAEPTEWAELWAKNCSNYKEFVISFEVLA